MRLSLGLFLLMFLQSCYINESENKKEDFYKTEAGAEMLKRPVFEKPNTDQDIFIQVNKVYSSKSNPLLDKNINIVIKSPIGIVAAIDFADPTLSISPDANVDLSKKFIVNFKNQTLASYFEYLKNITGYQLELVGSIVYIRSIQSKTWNLQSLSAQENQTLSSARVNVGSEDEDAPVAVNNKSSWEEIVNHVKAIMNRGELSTTAQKNLKKSFTAASVVTNNQQLGTISAIGTPQKISLVDDWIDNLINASNRQVHLQVQILDVTVDESVGRGIDWNLISKQSSGFQIDNSAGQVIDAAGIISIGTPAGAVIDLGKRITLDVMLNLLSKQGRVRVDNQINVTTRNGREAYITTGDEFSFTSKILATPDINGIVTTTAEIERMNVGVDMRVTPKILPDNRIVINVVPVISSLKSFTTLDSGGEEFKTPNIGLQKLATQVIVENGKTIHLGGLVASKVANAAKGLPGGGFMDLFFKGSQKSLERREIVILITPTIVR